jgi:hypothetical protein
MARVKFYLDARPTKDGKCHIKLSISHNSTTALMPTGVFVKTEHWNCGDTETEPHIKKTCSGYKALNSIITEKFDAAQQQINDLVLNGELNSFDTATHIKNHIQDKIDGKSNDKSLVEAHFKNFIERRNKSGTAGLYRETLVKIAKYKE